jgi:hypothetical protein
MALPKLASAKYELTVPSTGEQVEYRPFLVKEEKMLLMAQSQGDEKDMIRAVETLVDSCTFGKVDVKKLPLFDLEYMFLNIRAKSVGEKVELNLTCPDDGETKVPVEIDLTKIEVVKSPNHVTDIKISDNIGMVLDYPKTSLMSKMNLKNEGESVFQVIKACISQIYDDENVYSKADIDDKDLDDFIDSMSHSQFEKVQEFFNTMPKLKHTIKIKNPKTGVESDIELEGLNSFFQ